MNIPVGKMHLSGYMKHLGNAIKPAVRLMSNSWTKPADRYTLVSGTNVVKQASNLDIFTLKPENGYIAGVRYQRGQTSVKLGKFHTEA